MPYESKAQARLMRAVAHGWKPDKIQGPTKKVARKFMEESGEGPLHKAYGGSVNSRMSPPISTGLRTVDRTIVDSGKRLGSLIGRRAPLRKAEGGKVGVTVSAMKAIKDALGHLSNSDASSAKQTLQSDRSAAAHPEVRSALSDLQYGRLGVKKAVGKLQNLVESFSDQEEVPLLKKRGGHVKKKVKKFHGSPMPMEDEAAEMGADDESAEGG